MRKSQFEICHHFWAKLRPMQSAKSAENRFTFNKAPSYLNAKLDLNLLKNDKITN